MKSNRLFDSHAHLLDDRFRSDIDEAILGVDGIICMCSPGEDFKLFTGLLKKDFIWGAAGIHPHDAKDADRLWQSLEEALRLDKVMAVGEIGLDFYYNNSPEDVQKEVFRKQLKIARDLALPVIVHSRNAFSETFDILKKSGVKDVLIHCFSGNAEQMRESVGRGYCIAVGGVVTFPKAVEIKEAVREVPLDRLLIETDCPYLAPQPARGRRNQPAYVKYVAEEVAQIKGMELKDIVRSTYGNTANFFKL